MEEFLTIPEIVAAAERNLPKEVWDYSAGGAESEATLRRNRAAMERYTFRPRILRDVRRRSTEARFLGHPLALPVMIAPVGSIAKFHPDGALAAARAAGEAGTITFVSTMAQPGLEEVAAGAPGPLVFQLYVRGDRAWLASILERVERAGYAALCLTADTAVYGRRERDLHNRYFPREQLNRPNLEGIEPDDEYQAMLTWEDLDWLRARTRLPLVLKGVMTPEDAELAVRHGVDAVYVSNHGGRQLDHCPGTLEVLDRIVDAVAGRAEVIVDSGFLRGTDALKALALGARAVLIGKLACWALAAGGEAGLRRALELLRTEMETAMALLGVTHLGELGRGHLWEAAGAAPSEDGRAGRAGRVG